MQDFDTSIWEQDAYLQAADTCIVGAGLLGLWAAIELRRRQPGHRVVVLERHAVPLGASTRNAGFACFGSPTELLSDMHTMGTDTALTLVDMRWRGIAKLRQTFSDAVIDLEPCGGFECLSAEQLTVVADHLPELNAALAKITGQPETFSLQPCQDSDGGFRGFAATVANPFEGVLHSGKYVKALTTLAKSLGVELLYGAALLQAHPLAGSFMLYTTRGRLQTTNLVWATNGLLSVQCPELGIVPARGQMVLLQPTQPLAWQGAYHAEEGYYYWRHWKGCLLLGGGRHQAFQEEETLSLHSSERLVAHLQEYAHRHLLGDGATLLHHWAGTMAFAPQKLPVLERLASGAWAAMCCNGMGVALSPVFGEKVAEAVLAQ